MPKPHPITAKLSKWYEKNRRLLPWRESSNPYHIWLSEIILQQTRVDQGTAYYIRFIKLFPTVGDLANAPEDVVLHAWQGLGYYARARNLHAAAKAIVNTHQGEFPNKYAAIRELKGIGDYTAAAISSIAFGLPHAAVDGNVNRVIARLFAIDDPVDSPTGRRHIAGLAKELLDFENPGNHNQAMMELGALICTPRNPNCSNCPVQVHCSGFASKNQEHFPVKQGKTIVRNRFFTYLIFIDKNQETLVRKRQEKDIWQGLHEFPLIESKNAMDQNTLHNSLKARYPINHSASYRHQLSHQSLQIVFFTIRVDELPTAEWNNAICIRLCDVNQYALPRAITRHLSDVFSLLNETRTTSI
ncbi:MAG: A/G-specific adenine glycosylase [Bacteroidia bacterium]|jgi:A/G-specific adenine glycosylase